jgi:hypothetical protein
VNYFNGYCCCQPLSNPGTGFINHFACPSTSYHAIPHLCITLMTIVLILWSISVTPAFLTLINHLLNHTCFQNLPAELNHPLRNPGHFPSLSSSARVPRIPPAPPAPGPPPITCSPSTAVGHHTGNPAHAAVLPAGPPRHHHRPGINAGI